MEPRKFIFGSIFLLANRLQAVGDEILYEVTLKQWFLLVMVHNMPNPQPSVTEISQFIGTSRQNVRKMLETLEHNGYIALNANADDKRNLSVCLTEKSYSFFDRFEQVGDLFLEKLFYGISDKETEQTSRVFYEVLKNLDEIKQQVNNNEWSNKYE